jgi:hypothetical protein
MKHKSSILTALLLSTMLFLVSFAAKVGETAPDFTAKDSNGKTVKLSDYKGKFVVLEWHNNGCPYTKKHYASGNMQKLQAAWTAKGVIWLTVISSAPGTQGYVTAAEENDYMKQMNAKPTAALLDPDGDLGHLYSAKTTPHMFIIDPKGMLIYNGAIDSTSSSDAADIPSSTNYVNVALTEALAGKPVSNPATNAYGCSVKYKK